MNITSEDPIASDTGHSSAYRRERTLAQRRISLPAVVAFLTLIAAGVRTTAFGASTVASTPSATYAGNRFTALTQIDKSNVGSLGMAWKTAIADDGQQEASPIIWNGKMYLSTPHEGVIALDASDGKLLWQTPYDPKYVMLYAVNRGVGLGDGKVFIATQDCRVIALDAMTGKQLWNVQGCQDTSNSFYSMAAYVGNVYAVDAATGHEYWKEFTGSSVVAPISAYRLGGSEYLAVVVGEAGNQQTPNLPPTQGSYVIAYRLASGPTIVNDATGQVALANATNGNGESVGPIRESTGSAPYTQQQVAQGSAVYAKACAVCHGANLQGLSAPALTGAGFSHSQLNAEQLRTVVTQTMPLTAPGSLKPNDYAAIMAFLLSYDCVKMAGDGRPFPTTALTALEQVTLGATTCAPKGNVDVQASRTALHAITPETPSVSAVNGYDAARGKEIYADHCSACHQGDGQGVAGAFPPLKGSGVVNKDDATKQMHIVLEGLQGARAGGVVYKSAMPPFGDALSDADIADVVDYVRGSWGNQGKPVTAAQVAAERAAAQ